MPSINITLTNQSTSQVFNLGCTGTTSAPLPVGVYTVNVVASSGSYTWQASTGDSSATTNVLNVTSATANPISFTVTCTGGGGGVVTNTFSVSFAADCSDNLAPDVARVRLIPVGAGTTYTFFVVSGTTSPQNIAAGTYAVYGESSTGTVVSGVNFAVTGTGVTMSGNQVTISSGTGTLSVSCPRQTVVPATVQLGCAATCAPCPTCAPTPVSITLVNTANSSITYTKQCADTFDVTPGDYRITNVSSPGNFIYEINNQFWDSNRTYNFASGASTSILIGCTSSQTTTELSMTCTTCDIADPIIVIQHQASGTLSQLTCGTRYPISVPSGTYKVYSVSAGGTSGANVTLDGVQYNYGNYTGSNTFNIVGTADVLTLVCNSAGGGV